MRAVLDANVLVSAALSQSGAPAQLLERWLHGAFELIVSPQLLGEVERALAYPKVRDRLEEGAAAELLLLLGELAEQASDPDTAAPVQSPDPADDYLIALAASIRATLVSGDAHLLELEDAIPVVSPRAFLDSLD